LDDPARMSKKLLYSWFIAFVMVNAAAQRSTNSAVLDSPVTERTAVSFYWFGDEESHFRVPINFYVVPDGDGRLHKVNWNFPRSASAFMTASEMMGLIERLKALNLEWIDSKGREDFKDGLDRRDYWILDITVLSSKSTSRSGIRIARMWDKLARLDSAMPTPRILSQFQTFRWDNGCDVPGYVNYEIPPE
jgi:hypothetical protein